MKTFANRVIEFNRNLQYDGKLPQGFDIKNPFLENPETMEVMSAFYHQYYNDNRQRRLIVGINPGRLGAGTTGVPFTDTKRLKEFCHIEMKSANTHEPSSMFVYDMMMAFGGVEKFYNSFYINSLFPLAIVREKKGKWLNANYYDDKALFNCVKPYMIDSIRENINLGLDTTEVFSLGKKNAEYLERLNDAEHFFDKIVPLEHPRYIQQYKTKLKDFYIDKYLLAFKK